MNFNQKPFLYVFLDEAGNFDFSSTGTKYFILTAITMVRPFPQYSELTDLKYSLLESGQNLEYFHASEDSQPVRDAVFNIINKYLSYLRVDSMIVEKRKVGPALRSEEKFFPRMLGYLLRYVLNGHNLNDYSEVIVISDQIPVKKKQRAIEKAVKISLAEMLPEQTRYRVCHHDSKSNFNLQIADYCNWAIYRKWDRADLRSYNIVKKSVVSEFEIFKDGKTVYY